MERLREENGRLPANWAEIKQAPSGLEEMLTKFEESKYYRFEDRYVFPSKPIRASMQTTGYPHEGPVLLLRTVPLARAEQPFRLIRMVLMEYSPRDGFGTHLGVHIGRVQLSEDQFQKLLVENDMSLPSPAGAPAFENDYNESILVARWWPLMALAAIIVLGFAFTFFLRPQPGGWLPRSALIISLLCPPLHFVFSEGVGHPRWHWGSVATVGCILALLRLCLATKSLRSIDPGWLALALNGLFLVHSVSRVI